MTEVKFTTQRANDLVGYIEHVYELKDGRKLLVATIYETLDRRYKFSCKHKLYSESYARVCDARHDLLQLLEFHAKSPVDLTTA